VFHAEAETARLARAATMYVSLGVLLLSLVPSQAMHVSMRGRGHICEGRRPQMKVATNDEFIAALDEALGVYSFGHPGGEFEVHLRSKGRFWAPKFQCKSTWVLGGDGEIRIDFQQYGKYELQKTEDGSYSGSALGKPESWRTMAKTRSFSAAEKAVMDSKWEFEHAGGKFEVEFRADAFNHFVCDAYPAHSHWRLDNAESPTPTLFINWGKYGEYELDVAADGLSAAGSVKGRPDSWRRMKNLGVLGADLKQYAEHDH